MTIGIILLSVGIICIISGIVLIKKTQSDKPIYSDNLHIEPTVQVPKESISDKQKGDDFEKYVVQKFSKNYFSVLEWTGDKYVNGTYAKSNSHPDLAFKFKFKDVDIDFAVECKYRSDYYKNGVEWCTNHQLENYRTYARDKQRMVFIVIGIGGLPSFPEELFIIPLSGISETFLTKSFLSQYKKENFKDSNMFFDYEAGKLK